MAESRTLLVVAVVPVLSQAGVHHIDGLLKATVGDPITAKPLVLFKSPLVDIAIDTHLLLS